jgi:hypothetical protein
VGVDVRLRIFSGIADPRWALKPDAEATVHAWIRRPGRPSGTTARLPATGYRGFDLMPDGAAPHRVYRDALVSLETGEAVHTEPRMDEFLFGTNQEELFRFGVEERRLREQTLWPIAGLAPTCPSIDRRVGNLEYTPDLWGRGTAGESATCYAYANDVRTPVVLGNPAEFYWRAEELRDALAADGLVFEGPSLPRVAPPSDAHYIVALLNVIAGERGDYHFLRLDSTGGWSQKVGTGPVSNLDDAEQPINDLCAARFLTQFTLVGFFTSTDAVQTRLGDRGNSR